MHFAWNDTKNASNVLKHGVDFEDAIYIWSGRVVERPDHRQYAGEARFIAFGMVDERLLAVVYTWRGDTCRIISARKANKRERRAYDAALSGVAPDPQD